MTSQEFFLNEVSCTCRRENCADERVPEAGHPLVVVYDVAVRQLVISLCCFYEFSEIFTISRFFVRVSKFQSYTRNNLYGNKMFAGSADFPYIKVQTSCQDVFICNDLNLPLLKIRNNLEKKKTITTGYKSSFVLIIN